MINLLIVEDQQMVREAISALVGLDPFINVVGQAEDGKAALKFIKAIKAISSLEIFFMNQDPSTHLYVAIASQFQLKFC